MRNVLQTKARRGGFTLVELLVVIAIIGILVALTAVAVSGVTSSQRRANTVTAMTTIYQTLQTHWAYVVADAKKETGIPIAAIDDIFGPDATGGERDRIIWIKLRLMEAFPTSYGEIGRPFPYQNQLIPANMRKYNGTYKQVLGGRPHDDTNAHLTESSACLLMALSISRNGTALNFDNLGSSNVADTDGDGLKELVDNWGKPLKFFRFPTANQALQSSNPAASATATNHKYADPIDPGGVLYNWVGGSPKASNVFTNSVHALVSNFSYPNPANAAQPIYPACYVIPTIVSSGPDELLGLDASLANNMGISNAAAEADNIYSFKLRVGAGQEKLQ